MSSTALTKDESETLSQLDELCTKKIENQFSDRHFITVLHDDVNAIFKNRKHCAMRKQVILDALKENAKQAGWELNRDTDENSIGYYIKPIK